MKSPDRDAADEITITERDTMQYAIDYFYDWMLMEGKRADEAESELATLRRRAAEMDRKTIERSLTLAADLLGGSMRAAARANIFGPLCDAYSGAASEMRLLAALAKSGDEIRDNNGLVWLAAETPDAPLPPGRNEG